MSNLKKKSLTLVQNCVYSQELIYTNLHSCFSSLGQLDIEHEAAEVLVLGVLQLHLYVERARREALIHIQCPMVGLCAASLNWTGRGLASVSVHSDQGQVHVALRPVSLAVQSLDREFGINIETDLHRTSLLHATG